MFCLINLWQRIDDRNSVTCSTHGTVDLSPIPELAKNSKSTVATRPEEERRAVLPFRLNIFADISSC